MPFSQPGMMMPQTPGMLRFRMPLGQMHSGVLLLCCAPQQCMLCPWPVAKLPHHVSFPGMQAALLRHGLLLCRARSAAIHGWSAGCLYAVGHGAGPSAHASPSADGQPLGALPPVGWLPAGRLLPGVHSGICVTALHMRSAPTDSLTRGMPGRLHFLASWFLPSPCPVQQVGCFIRRHADVLWYGRIRSCAGISC